MLGAAAVSCEAALAPIGYFCRLLLYEKPARWRSPDPCAGRDELFSLRKPEAKKCLTQSRLANTVEIAALYIICVALLAAMTRRVSTGDFGGNEPQVDDSFGGSQTDSAMFAVTET